MKQIRKYDKLSRWRKRNHEGKEPEWMIQNVAMKSRSIQYVELGCQSVSLIQHCWEFYDNPYFCSTNYGQDGRNGHTQNPAADRNYTEQMIVTVNDDRNCHMMVVTDISFTMSVSAEEIKSS